MKLSTDDFIAISGHKLQTLEKASQRLEKGDIFEGVLQVNGFIKDTEKESVFTKKKTGETIILKREGSQLKYSNPNVATDKGNLLDFFQRRITNGRQGDREKDIALFIEVVSLGITYEKNLKKQAVNTKKVKRQKEMKEAHSKGKIR